MLQRSADRDRVRPPERDGVDALEGTPPIVSLSDVHGYLSEAESALLAVGDHPDYDPVVEADSDGLHWAGNDYVLVLNGDLVDRGPDNEAAMRTAARLVAEAPPGRVRVTFGNHEMPILVPEVLSWPRWFSGQVDLEGRRAFYEAVLDGAVVAAYEGYDHTYAHAGQPDPYDPAGLNDRLRDAADRLLGVAGTPRDGDVQSEVAEEYPTLFGTGGMSGRGPGAGICWLDFSHMPEDAPPQVVGHTRHEEPTRKGEVVCENVIRSNRDSPGGEAVLVERPGELVALVREPDGGVDRLDLSRPEFTRR